MRQKHRYARLLAVLLIVLLPFPAMAEAPPIQFVTNPAELDVAYIRDGELVTNFNYPNDKGIIARYTGVDLGEAPEKVSCRARFDGGGAVALIAYPAGKWSLAGLSERSIHVVFASDSYHLGFFEDGILTDVLTGEYTLDTTGEKEYTFGFAISKSTITLQLPTGKTAKKKDDRVLSCNGRNIIYEHYLSAGEVEREAAPVITYVYAKGRALPALEDDFQRGDGLPYMAPSGHLYAEFRNE